MPKYVVHFKEPLFVPVDKIDSDKYYGMVTQETFLKVELTYDPTMLKPANSGRPQFNQYDFPDEWITLHMPNNGTKLKLHLSMIKYVEIKED